MAGYGANPYGLTPYGDPVAASDGLPPGPVTGQIAVTAAPATLSTARLVRLVNNGPAVVTVTASGSPTGFLLPVGRHLPVLGTVALTSAVNSTVSYLTI